MAMLTPARCVLIVRISLRPQPELVAKLGDGRTFIVTVVDYVEGINALHAMTV